MCAIEKNPGTELSLDLENMVVSCGSEKFKCTMPDTYRNMLISGNWDISSVLLANLSKVRDFSEKMPYLNGFKKFA